MVARLWVLSLCMLFTCAGDLSKLAAQENAEQNKPDANKIADFVGSVIEEPLLHKEKVLEAAQKYTREAFPNADDVLIDDRIVVRYNQDGTYGKWDEWYTKVLTEKGKKRHSDLAMHFTIPYSLPEDVQVRQIEIIKPDGRTLEVDLEKQSKVMIDRSQMSSNIYNPNSKILRVGIPNVEVGDIVHYYTYKRVRHPRFKGVWGDMQIFEYTSPIGRYVYEVYGPKNKPLKSVQVRDEVDGTLQATQGTKHGLNYYRWEVNDVPRMYKEPNMPPLFRVVQRLLISTAPSWETISKWYWELSEPHYQITDAIHEKAQALVEGIDTDKQKIRELFKFVSQEIRYLGITREETAPGYEPHDVSETFEKKAGVCRDKAALLVAMLRDVGFDAFPVLIHSSAKKDPEVPLPWFNHAVVAVDLGDKDYLLMDPTDESTRQLLPGYLNDKSYLVARPDGDHLRTSPIVPASENMMRIQTRGTLATDGTLTARSVLEFEGMNDNAYRGYFARIKPVERQRLFEGLIKRVAPGATLDDFVLEPENMMNTDKALRVELAFTAEDMLIKGDNANMLPLPRFGTRVGYTNFILDGAGLEKREYPFQTEIACGVHESFELRIAEGVGSVLSLPEYPKVNSKEFDWTFDLTHDSRVLRGDSVFELKTVEFSTEAYGRLKELLRDMAYNSRKMPLLARKAIKERSELAAKEEADSIKLKEKSVYVLQSTQAWTYETVVERKILTYAGKKKYSEIKIPYNVAWEKVELIEAEVRNQEGDEQTVTKVDPSEVNIMDAGWVGSAPRYPATKIMVVSFPAVREGSVIRYKIKRTVTDKPFFACRESFVSFEPVKHKLVRIELPQDVQTSVFLDQNGTVKPESLDKNGFRVQHAMSVGEDGGLVREWEATDIPPLPRESGVPPSHTIGPVLFFSTGDWARYAADVADVLREAAKTDQSVKAKSDALHDKEDSSKEKVLAIRNLVARAIRDAGPGLSAMPLTAVTDAAKTLEQGYGNSADRAVLLWSLLRAAGFAPEFVLAASGARTRHVLQPWLECPNSAFFNTVLVRVKLDDRLIYLNDTNQYDRLGVVGHDRLPGLLMSGNFITIEAEEDYHRRVERVYEVDLNDAGDAHVTYTKRLFGRAYGSRNRFFQEMPPEERQREFQQMVAGLSQNAVPKTSLITRFDEYPGVEKFAVQWKRFAVVDGEYMYMRLPNSFDSLFRLRSDTRFNPIHRSGYRQQRIKIRLRLPPSFGSVEGAPRDIHWESPNDSGVVEVKSVTEVEQIDDQERQVLEIQYNADLEPAILRVENYPDLLDIMKRLSHPQAETVLLKKEKTQE
jgi:transglutaminase-like putative cysteine protease